MDESANNEATKRHWVNLLAAGFTESLKMKFEEEKKNPAWAQLCLVHFSFDFFPLGWSFTYLRFFFVPSIGGLSTFASVTPTKKSRSIPPSIFLKKFKSLVYFMVQPNLMHLMVSVQVLPVGLADGKTNKAERSRDFSCKLMHNLVRWTTALGQMSPRSLDTWIKSGHCVRGPSI